MPNTWQHIPYLPTPPLPARLPPITLRSSLLFIDVPSPSIIPFKQQAEQGRKGHGWAWRARFHSVSKSMKNKEDIKIYLFVLLCIFIVFCMAWHAFWHSRHGHKQIKTKQKNKNSYGHSFQVSKLLFLSLMSHLPLLIIQPDIYPNIQYSSLPVLPFSCYSLYLLSQKESMCATFPSFYFLLTDTYTL